MSSSRTSRFKPSGVSGFPTWWGAAMFILVGAALFYSMTGRAPVEQWIALLMIIIILIQLVEISTPFRTVEVSLLPILPPFANEIFVSSFEISNPKDVPTDTLYFRLNLENEWMTSIPLEPRGRARIDLSSGPFEPGKHNIASVRIKTRSRSELFQLWRRVRIEAEVMILPAAINHGISISKSAPQAGSSELSHLESIKDERLMFKMDQKIFLKTGKPYYRVMEQILNDEKISLDWSNLASLSEKERGEQFSNWLKQCRSLSQSYLVDINTPFAKMSVPLKSIDWFALHEAYAEWLYAET